MKNPYILFFVLIFVMPVTLNSQTHHHVDVDINLPKRFKQGDNYYESSFQGLKSFMIDLQTYDNETYQQLVPVFNRIKEKRSNAIFTGGACSLVGLSMCAIGGNRLMDNISPENTDNFIKDNTRGTGLIIAGGITTLIGIYLYSIISPSDNDVYQFMNSHNRLNKNKKLEWNIGLTSLPENGYGAFLCFRF